ncbi:MAG: hypothetical protein A2Z38_12550 [Planctomycetes bacterium RBG_19FT_COMBO_48_8]|nr:MAG: hypothetical protein A2Z38_12550 [Planctomycetes bacterium RBG_19FT_COMBO_48_8]
MEYIYTFRINQKKKRVFSTQTEPKNRDNKAPMCVKKGCKPIVHSLFCVFRLLIVKQITNGSGRTYD